MPVSDGALTVIQTGVDPNSNSTAGGTTTGSISAGRRSS